MIDDGTTTVAHTALVLLIYIFSLPEIYMVYREGDIESVGINIIRLLNS